MTVKKLIEELIKLDTEKNIYVSGYEGGINDLSEVVPIKVKRNQNDEWWMGKHKETDYEEEFDEEGYRVG